MFDFRELLGRTFDDYYEPPKMKRGSSSRKYQNKNKNVEYYEDEKGNIRRRKIKQ